MDRDIEDLARRLEARAFLYGDPGSFRDGVAAALREVAAARAVDPAGAGDGRDRRGKRPLPTVVAR